jgi:hypothetical protein
MMRMNVIHKRCLLFVASIVVGMQGVAASAGERWPMAPFGNKDFFPIGVWLQAPAKASAYRAAGINVYIGLWNGPTAEQLQQLTQAGMFVICTQNDVGLARLKDPIIAGWMQMDEPDNAQPQSGGQGGYGPPVAPEKIVERYKQMHTADPNRPILLNLGQGVAWDEWVGRGIRTNHPEDYPLYVQGCDIASFDIYPVTIGRPQITGKLWYIARGVERLTGWAGDKRPVWTCVECTHDHNADAKATPEQVRCEVWMSIVHGSTGIVYFVHEWKPRFNEAALLSDPNMLAAVTAINRRIQQLAPVLNSPTLTGQLTVAVQDEKVPIATMVKRDDKNIYVFAVAMRDAANSARFTISGLSDVRPVTVLDENRSLLARSGVFSDDFAPWDVHLYRIPTGDVP